MTDSADSPFSQAVIDAICRHMNVDHAEDSLLISRALGGRGDATAAHMATIDDAGATFVVDEPTGTTTVVVPWSEPITERAHIRAEVVRMYHESCALLGLPARQEHG